MESTPSRAGLLKLLITKYISSHHFFFFLIFSHSVLFNITPLPLRTHCSAIFPRNRPILCSLISAPRNVTFFCFFLFRGTTEIVGRIHMFGLGYSALREDRKWMSLLPVKSPRQATDTQEQMQEYLPHEPLYTAQH